MMRRLLASMALLLLVAIISMAQEGNDGIQSDNNMGIVEKNVKILNKLHFNISKNYYFTRIGRREYYEYFREYYIDEFENVENPESRMHPNMMVEFYSDEKGNFQCDYVLWKPRWLELEKNNPKMNIYEMPLAACGDSKHSTGLCDRHLTLQEARYLKLPIIPYSYFPSAVTEHNPISNIADMYTTLNGLDAHDALRTCASAYLFRGENLSRGLHILRKGHIECHLELKTNKQNQELLEKGYTVTLNHIHMGFCESIAIGYGPGKNGQSDLVEYTDMDRPNGDFLLGAILGSAKMNEIGGFDCGKQKEEELFLELKIKHHCSEDGKEKLTTFKFPLNRADAPNGIFDWKEMMHNNKTITDRASVILKESKSLLVLPNKQVYSGIESASNAKPDGGKKFKKEL